MLEASRARGVEPAEGHLLSYVTLYGPCPVSELTRVFGTRPSTLTGMLDRLEERGLLLREPNPRDRRSLLVGVTDPGAVIATELRAKLEAFEEELRSRVCERDLKGFDAVIRAIADITQVDLTKEGRK
jgi:DNA-binding MarR family transcriptional regulator